MRVLTLSEFMDRYYASDAYAKYCNNNNKIDVIDSYTGDIVARRFGGTPSDAKAKAKELLKEFGCDEFYAKVWNDLDKAGVRIGKS